METTTSEYIWPKCFEDEALIRGMTPIAACGDALEAWALCHVSKAPKSFGNVMVLLHKRAGNDGTLPEAFSKRAKELVPNA
jgi:hypothetical protein